MFLYKKTILLADIICFHNSIRIYNHNLQKAFEFYKLKKTLFQYSSKITK